MPVISVIVPVYKAEKYIEDCVQSILSQTYGNFELILVNDGSPDASGAICDRLAEKDARIRVIHKENGGAATARNAGLDAAQGEYIAFVDGDDLIHPQYLEFLYRLLTRSSADAAWCHYDFFTQEVSCFGRPLEIESETAEYVTERGAELLENFRDHARRVSLISLCMKLYRREVFDGLRIPEGYIEEDSMVLPMILERVEVFAHVKLPLYHWRETVGSVTRSGLTEKSFAYIEVSRFQAEFFRARGSDQAHGLQRDFMQRTMKYYYRIQDEKPELMKAYRYHLKRYRNLYPRYIKAKGMSPREWLAYTIFLVAPKAARKLYMQVYGERYRREYW